MKTLVKNHENYAFDGIEHVYVNGNPRTYINVWKIQQDGSYVYDGQVGCAGHVKRYSTVVKKTISHL